MGYQSVLRPGFFVRADGCAAVGWFLSVGRILWAGKMKHRASLRLMGYLASAVALLSFCLASPTVGSGQASSLTGAALTTATSPSWPKHAKLGTQEVAPLRRTDAYFLRPRDVVLFLGNSITELAKPEVEYLITDLQNQYSQLAEGDGRVTFVLAGQSGEQAYQGAARVKALIDQHKPTVCVVCYGTCEVTFRNQKSFIPAMKDIIRQCKNAGIMVTIVSPPPPSAKNWKQVGPWPASQFVDGLPEMVTQSRLVTAGEGILFVDAYASLAAYAEESGKEFTTDGIHLNADGYRVMADALQKAWGFGKPLDKPENPTTSVLPAPHVFAVSENNGRRIVQYSHESISAWGYAKPQSDVFWLALPPRLTKTPPICVVLHSAGGDGQEPFQPVCAPQYVRGFYGDETFYVLSLDCAKNRNDWWWGVEEIKRNPDRYLKELCPVEKRVLSTIEWVVNEFRIDRNRVYLNGISMGGSGSLGIGLNHGDVFAAVSVVIPAGIEHMNYRLVAPLPDPPPLINISSHLDSYAEGQEALLRLFAKDRYALAFAWGPFGHVSGAIGAANASVYEYPWFSIRKNEAYPVFTYATTDNHYPGHMNATDPDQNGQINGYFRWKNMEDTRERFVMELHLVRKEELRQPVELPREAVAEITLRRLQKFPVRNGTDYQWTMTVGGKVLQSGKTTATARGILTIPTVKISDTPTYLSIVAARQMAGKD